jgi:hypothetical protein
LRSTLDTYSLNEEHSRELISKFCRLNIWKYRKMEWDNDIDGEIEIFDESKQTTAKFIKIQLKTIDNPNSIDEQEEFLLYDTNIKFLNFCDVCDIPVVLIVFNIQKETGYYLFVQQYIYENLDIQNPDWRTNKSNVRLKIPFNNSLFANHSRSEFEKIAFYGINITTQLRKTETYKKYFTVLSQSDNSHGTALRTSVKLLIEKSFSTSKEALRILIPKVNSHFIENVYLSNEIRQRHFIKDKKCQVIFMGLYDGLEQANHGLPFCNTLWIDDKLPQNAWPMVFKADEILSGININWVNDNGLSKIIEENQLNKGTYVPYLDNAFNQFFSLYENIKAIYSKYNEGDISYQKLIKKMKKYDNKLSGLNDLFHNFGFPPFECKDIDVQINSMICLLDNIRIVISDTTRQPDNIIACIKMYISSIEETLPEYRYERKKIR